MSEIINKFKFLKEFSEEIVQVIKLFYVFDNFILNKVDNVYNKSGTNVLFITEHGECYAFGENSYGVLGFGDNIPKINPMQVKELCEKNIVEFVNGVTHCMARSGNGTAYCFGSNNFGQIGINTLDDVYYKPIANPYLPEEKVISICCGYGHSLVLTCDGEIYGWGRNSWGQIGNDCNDDQLIPIKVKGFNGARAISTGSGHSIALTFSGYVYSWGDNSFGQLGVENNYDSNKPHLVPIKSSSLKDIIVDKVQCGHSHSIILTKSGEIFEFRFKKLSQIGIGSRNNLFKPSKVNIDKKCIDIASHSFYNISIALSDEHKFYIWGNWNSVIHEKPIVTEFTSFNEIFINYLGITYKSTKVIDYDIISILPFTQYKKDFKEICCISSGNFAVVYKCSDKKDKKLYAIKKIPLNNTKAEEIRLELKIMMQLKSKYIVPCKKSWIEKNYYLDNKIGQSEKIELSDLFNPINKYLLHIQMEFCEKTLKEALTQLEFEIKEEYSPYIKNVFIYIKSELFKEILEGILFLHQNKVIHRDLKPNNILITNGKNGRFVKIADFGLSVIHGSQNVTHTKEVGTLKYMAPELMRTRKYDMKVDIFSLGVILQELFVNEEQYLEDTSTKFYQNPFQYKLNIIFDLIKEMLSFNPDKRPNCDEIFENSSNCFISINEIVDYTFDLYSKEKKEICSINENFLKFFIQTKFIKYCETLQDFRNISQRNDYKSINLIPILRYDKFYNEFNLVEVNLDIFIYKVKSKIDSKMYGVKAIPVNASDVIKYHKEFNTAIKLRSKYIVELISVWIEKNYYTNDSIEKDLNKYSIFKLFNQKDKRQKDYLLHIQTECMKSLDKLIWELKNEFSTILNPIYFYINCELFIEILECIEYIHKQNIIHRYLCPQNIMITKGENGRFVKIAVFHEHNYQSHTPVNKYMAPEVSSENIYDSKADIYSLGILLEDLFNLKIANNRNTDGKFSSAIIMIVSKKLQGLLNLKARMLSKDASLRPTCRDILNSKMSWSWNLYEFKDNTEVISLLKQQNLKDKHCNGFPNTLIQQKMLEYKNRESFFQNSIINSLMTYIHGFINYWYK